jgi:hypothetical protein
MPLITHDATPSTVTFQTTGAEACATRREVSRALSRLQAGSRHTVTLLGNRVNESDLLALLARMDGAR